MNNNVVWATEVHSIIFSEPKVKLFYTFHFPASKSYRKIACWEGANESRSCNLAGGMRVDV